MDRDTAFLLIFLGLPLLLGTLAVAFGFLGRRAAAVNCPNCGKRIPKTAITIEGVRCRNCDWCLKASGEHRRPG